MCGRYTLFDEHDSEKLQEILRALNEKSGYAPTDINEVRPTDVAPVLRLEHGVIAVAALRWGFPHFKSSGVIINARAETALEKPMFRKALLERRCAIPTAGFFEWQDVGNKKKIKHRATGPEQPVLYLAGMWERFSGGGESFEAFVILTTQASGAVAAIHDRMPVVLSEEELLPWMSDPRAMRQILSRPGPELELRQT